MRVLSNTLSKVPCDRGIINQRREFGGVQPKRIALDDVLLAHNALDTLAFVENIIHRCKRLSTLIVVHNNRDLHRSGCIGACPGCSRSSLTMADASSVFLFITVGMRCKVLVFNQCQGRRFVQWKKIVVRDVLGSERSRPFGAYRR